MNTQSNHFVKKTTAILSAIAASSFLGLPALAGGLNPEASRVVDQAQNQAQAPSNSTQLQCTPTNQAGVSSSNSATGTSSMATPTASASGAAQVPNQADPRTGATSADQTVGSNTDRPAADTSSNQTSGAYASNGSYSDRSQTSAYGDVLSQGGATAGGFARQQVAAANNPDAYSTVSSRYTSNDPRANFGNYGNRSNAMGNTSGTMNPSDSMRSDSMRSDSMSQSSNQSSMMTGTTMARCPEGMMPQSTTPNTRQAPDQLNQGVQISPQPADPQTRQSPADGNGSGAR